MALPSYQPQPCVHDACLGLTRVQVHNAPPPFIMLLAHRQAVSSSDISH